VQDRDMPNYRWSCLACGHANNGGAIACTGCTCPACATAKQIRAIRATFVERGGKLRGDAAASFEPDLSAFDVLVVPILGLILGWLPFTGLFRAEALEALRSSKSK
jgi:hypothetical protein